MKKILLLILMMILWTSICSAESYKYLMTDNRGDYYIDLDSIKDMPNDRLKDLTKVKTKVVLNSEFKKERTTEADYFIETYIIDKDTKDYMFKVIDKYKNNGTQIDSYEFQNWWINYGTTNHKKEFVNKILEEIKQKEGK